VESRRKKRERRKAPKWVQGEEVQAAPLSGGYLLCEEKEEGKERGSTLNTPLIIRKKEREKKSRRRTRSHRSSWGRLNAASLYNSEERGKEGGKKERLLHPYARNG